MEIRTVSPTAIKECARLNALMEKKGIGCVLNPLPRIIFAPTDSNGRLGYFDADGNIIVLSENFLKETDTYNLDATFLHELSHAVDHGQRGFSQHDARFREICSALGVPDGFEKSKVRMQCEQKDKVRCKVKKLISLSESPFENESMEALKAAQRLMSKYSLKEECNNENEERMYSCQMDAKSRFFFYEKVFASIIIKLSGALILREKRGKNIALTAYGSIEQVQFAYETYLFLKKALKDTYDKEKQTEKNLDYYSFAAGLASMLYEKIKKCEEQSDARALAISYRDNRRIFEHIFSSSKITGRRTRAMFQSREAYEKGEIASKGINIPQREAHTYIRKIEDKREK